MNTINHLVCTFFDLIFSLFASRHPFWGLMAISMVTGIIMLLIFRYLSDQQGIRKIKNKVKARIFELRLFGHDLSLMWESQKDLFRDNLTYLKFSVKPMLVMVVPVGLIIIQTSLWFELHPLTAGTSAIVSMKFAKSAPFREDVALKVPKGIVVETPALRIPEKKEIDWRIKAERIGKYDLTFVLDSGIVTKSVVVSERLTRISARRVPSNILQRFLHPGEKPLPDETGLECVEVSYPTIPYRVLGSEVHWLVLFFVLSIATGFLLKGLCRVEL